MNTSNVAVSKKHRKEEWSKLRWATYNFLKSFIKDKKDLKILDLGCGQSQYDDLLTSHNVTKSDVYNYENVNLVFDANENFPIIDKEYDLVIAMHVLEHLHNPQGAVKECFRVLKPGGFFVGVTPFMMAVHHRPHDYWRFTDVCLKKILDDAGFTKIDIETCSDVSDILDSVENTYYNALANKYWWGRLMRKINRVMRAKTKVDDLDTAKAFSFIAIK